MALSGDQELADRSEFGVRYTIVDPTTVRVVVATWDDPGPNPVFVTLDADGIPREVTGMVRVGTDYANNANLPVTGGVTPVGIQGQVGWVGSLEIPCPLLFPNKNPYTVSQPGTGRGTVIGSFRCAPSPGQHHQVHVGTCDRALAATQGAAFNTLKEPQSSGMYQFIMDDDDDPSTPPISAVCMVDDINGYVDWQWVDDTADSSEGIPQTGATGHRNTNMAWQYRSNSSIADSALAYDYALAYFIAMGMGSVNSTDADDVGSAGERTMSYWGRNASRMYVQHNLPSLFQYGDHEICNDFGVSVTSSGDGPPAWGGGFRTGVPYSAMDIPVSSVFPDDGTTDAPNGVLATGEWARYAWNAAIEEVYKLMMGPLQGGSLQNVDVGANHWGVQLGDLYLVSPDAIYNAEGGTDKNGGLAPNGEQPPMTAMFGLDQISDLKDAMDNSVAWKAILSPIGFRSLNDDTVQTSKPANRAVNWPLYNLQRSEFDSLVVANDGKSVMDNPNTKGKTVFISGDTHYQWSGHATAPANGGNVAEDLTVCNIGTISGSDLVSVASDIQDNNDIEFLTKSPAWGSDKRDRGFGIVTIQIKETMRVYMVNGKINSNFDVGIDRVFSGDGDMVSKTYTEAEAETDSRNYKMTGDERVGFDADDPAFPGRISNYGRLHRELAQLYSDLGLQIELVPGSAKARAEVLRYITTPPSDGGASYLDQFDVNVKTGLMSMTCRVAWHKTGTAQAIVIDGVSGGGPGRYSTVYTYAASETSGIIEIYYQFNENGDIYMSSSLGGSNVRTAQLLDPASVGVAVHDAIWDGSDVDGLVVDDISYTFIDATPRQVATGLSEFQSLKNYLTGAKLNLATEWEDALDDTLLLQTINGSKFSVLEGVNVLMKDIPAANTTVAGSFAALAADKDVLVVFVGKIDAASMTSFGFGATVQNSGFLGVDVFKTGGLTAIYYGAEPIPTTFPGVSNSVDLCAFVIPAAASVNDAAFKYAFSVDPETIVSQAPSGGSLKGSIDSFGSDFNADSASDAIGLFSVMFFQFDDGIPDDVDEALAYMAVNQELGPYPGWHSLK